MFSKLDFKNEDYKHGAVWKQQRALEVEQSPNCMTMYRFRRRRTEIDRAIAQTAGKTIPNGTLIMLGAVTATGVTPGGDIKRRCTRGPVAGVQGMGWHACVGVHCHSASNSENSSRETVLEHQPTFLTPCTKFHFCTVHDKIYLYTYMPNAFYARKESPYITLEKYVYAVLTGASPHQFLTYQRCHEHTHTLQVKQKAPRQHHNFLKTKQKMRSIEAESLKKKSLNGRILYFQVSPVQLQPKLTYIYIYHLVCYCLSLIHF